jgi:hypothetical protein
MSVLAGYAAGGWNFSQRNTLRSKPVVLERKI